MSEFKALSRSFSRNALKKLGMGARSEASPSVTRRSSRRDSRDGRETHKNRPHPIVDSDHVLLDENFIKTVIPKKESAQAIILEVRSEDGVWSEVLRPGEPRGAPDGTRTTSVGVAELDALQGHGARPAGAYDARPRAPLTPAT